MVFLEPLFSIFPGFSKDIFLGPEVMEGANRSNREVNIVEEVIPPEKLSFIGCVLTV